MVTPEGSGDSKVNTYQLNLDRQVTPGDRIERGIGAANHAIGKAHEMNEIELAEKRTSTISIISSDVGSHDTAIGIGPGLSNPTLMVHRARSSTPSARSGRRGSEHV